MSAVSSRPRVQTVSSSLFDAAAAGIAVALGSIIREMCGSSASADSSLFAHGDSRRDTTAFQVQPVSALRAQRLAREDAASALVAAKPLPAVERLKMTALLSLSETPYLALPTAVKPCLNALLQASTADAVIQAKATLLAVVDAGHHGLFVEGVVLACRRASLQVGFGSVLVAAGDGADAVRVIATDPSGRALVSEVRTDAKGEVSIDTEVVGISDGSCKGILDAFDQSLEAQGVRASDRARKPTGGVCELKSSREFLRHKVQRKAATQSAPVAGSGDAALRRRQQLNTPTRQVQR